MDRKKAPYADNPTEGLVPLSITPLCVNRMIGWATIVSHLIKYLSIVVDQEKRLSDSLSKTSQELTAALSSDNLTLFAQEESVRSLLSDMTDQQAKRASIRSTSAMNIEEQLIPILKELLGQIKKKVTEPDQKWVQLDKDLQYDLETYVKLSGQLKASLARQNWKESMDAPDIPKDCPKDPWLANLAFQKHIDQCHAKQADYRILIKEQEDDFAAFEAVVVQNIKVSLATFYEWRSGTFSQQVDQIKTMKSQLDEMDPERDWSVFKKHHVDRFLQPCPLVEIKDLQFEGNNDPALEVVKQGRLQKKEGVFKRAYKPFWGVLTPSSYFHVMPELQKGEKFLGQPELTLDLTEFTLQPLMMNEKDPEEIAFVAKTSGMFGRDVKHKFKGQHLAESAEWWGVFNEQMRNQKERKNLPSPTRTTPEKVIGSGGEIVAGHEDVKAKPTIQDKEKKPSAEPPNRPPSPERPPPMPPRTKSNLPELSNQSLSQPEPPVTNSFQTNFDYNIPNATFANPDYYQSQIASIPSFVPESLSPDVGMSKLSVAERMELAMKSKIQQNAELPTEIPSFETRSQEPTFPKAPSNPWDTFEADQARW